MVTGCNQIDTIIKYAIKDGNKIFHSSENRDTNGRMVLWFSEPLTNKLKIKIDSSGLGTEYWFFKGVPHNPGASGYKCNNCNVVVAFPDTKTPNINIEND